ncbi:hypothetical protein U9M48_008489 [Paspalum notatum var. saurae]|uniref:Uncharacterized protein n=1 Tax=Paspalum notatum var. saurae TaxID=547442 RepID=A0AAQ3WDH5_PASNO
MRRSFETCPDDSDTEAPVHTDRTAQQNATIQTNLEDDALAAANELMTNLNIAAQGISERTSTRLLAEPGLPKFDVSVEDPKVPTAAALPTSSNQNPCNTGGSETTGDVLQPDNGPVFDETPYGHGSSVPPTTPIANIVKPTRTECALALREFLCTRDVKIDKTVMDFGGYISTYQDVKESFADGASLDSVFMQYFIECVRSDDSANLPSSNTSRLILDTNVGTIINIEELEQHSQNPQTFDPVILQNYLATTLTLHPGLKGIKTFYDFRDASILLFLDPDMLREYRSLLLQYLTFHRNNKSHPLPPNIQRFYHSDH